MWDERFERSDVNEEDEDEIVPAGTMVSFWMVARMPRWEDDVIRVPRADLSSWEAVRVLVGLLEGFGRRGRNTRDSGLHLC